MSNRKLIVNIQRRGGIDNDAAMIQHIGRVTSLMFSARMSNTLRLTVKVRAGLGKVGVMGVAKERSSVTTTARSKHYVILVQRDMPLHEQLNTLTHELQHILQFATGRLAGRKTYGKWGWHWRPVGHTGAAVKYDAEGINVVPWHRRPWEVEALAAEEKFAFLLGQG